MGDWNFDFVPVTYDEESDIFFEPPSYRLAGESCENCCSSQKSRCSQSGLCQFYKDVRCKNYD